jgi:hypothetical protein
VRTNSDIAWTRILAAITNFLSEKKRRGKEEGERKKMGENGVGRMV